MHGLSIPEKREFYSGLARLIRSGSSLPNALGLLARDTPGGVGAFIRALAERTLAGESLGDALLQQRPRVTPLEASIVIATERAGRLDHGCEQLARYFQALRDARAVLRKRLAYPAVVLHLAVVCLTLPNVLLAGGGLRQYLVQAIAMLAAIYAGVTLLFMAWGALSRAAGHNAAIDAALGRLPGLGALRRNFALARFFAALDAQLEGGVNVWEAFANAARASDSGHLIQGARDSLPMLQKGEPLSEVLARNGAMPAAYLRTFRVAEQTGELDQELPRLAQEAEAAALSRLEWLSVRVLPGIIYAVVVLFIVLQLVQAMHRYTAFLQKVGE